VTGAERACAAIAEAHGRVNASYGVARWPEDGPDDDGLLAAADVRLYEMKGARGRRVGVAREIADSRRCCRQYSERVAALGRLSRRLAQVGDLHEVIEVSTQELSSGFSCYRPSIVAGTSEGGVSCVPIRVGGRAWGALSLTAAEHGLHDEDRVLLDAAVAQIGLALQFAELRERAERKPATAP
jgi:GAF domain-containing protein